MKEAIHSQAYFILILLLLTMSCKGRQDGALDVATAPAETSSSEQLRDQKACSLPEPALQEVLFVSVDGVLAFRGYLNGVADEQMVNCDRVPLITLDGEHWSRIRGETINFESIHFTSLSQGWLVNIRSELWKTEDGGVSWAFVSRIQDGEETLVLSQQVIFVDELNGWILDLDALWQTQDGGRTWSRHDFPRELSRRFCLRGDVVWVASRISYDENNFIFKTQDAGRSWQEIEVPHTRLAENPDSDIIDDIFFAETQTGWFVKPHTIYRTVDGGQSWQKQRLPRSGISLKSLCFINDREGWAAGRKFRPGEPEWDEDLSEAVLLHTTNAGETWIQVDIGARQTMFDKVYFGDSQNGWLVAQEETGEFYRNANLYNTRDGGATWARILAVKSPYQLE